MKIKLRAHSLILLTGLILVFMSFFAVDKQSTVDIHLHDTYFIIAHIHLFRLLSIIAVIIWILCLLINRFLFSKLLVWTHVIITIVTLLTVAFSLYYIDNILEAGPRRYYDLSSFTSLNTYNKLSAAVPIAITVLLLGQIIFILNIILGLLKRTN